MSPILMSIFYPSYHKQFEQVFLHAAYALIVFILKKFTSIMVLVTIPRLLQNSTTSTNVSVSQ